jgi:hypothetical protein
MNRTDAPTKQGVPFGVNGNREPIEATTAPGDNSASYDVGFPPITMILKSAGGLPPKGQDMNQILYELSALSRWCSTGAINGYDSDFSLLIGGYPNGSLILGDNGTDIYINTVNSNNTNPNNSGAGWQKITSFLGVAMLSDFAYSVNPTTIISNQPGGIKTICGILTSNTDANGNIFINLPDTFLNKLIYTQASQMKSSYTADTDPFIFSSYPSAGGLTSIASFAVRNSKTGVPLQNSTISYSYIARGY